MKRRIWLTSATIMLLLGAGTADSLAQTFTHQQSLRPPGVGVSDQFGPSVAISGDTLVVGARELSDSCDLSDWTCALEILVNCVTIAGISVDQWGTVTADVFGVSANANATFTLRVTDTTGLYAEATLVVWNPPSAGFQQ